MAKKPLNQLLSWCKEENLTEVGVSGVRLFVRAGHFAETPTSPAFYPKRQAGSNSSCVSLTLAKRAKSHPWLSSNPVSLKWVTQPQCDQHTTTRRGEAQDTAVQQGLCKANNSSFHSLQHEAKTSEKKTGLLPPEVLVFTDISHNCICLPRWCPPAMDKLRAATRRSTESCYS